MAGGIIQGLLSMNRESMSSGTSSTTSPRDISTILRLPTSGELDLSPLDVTSRGRPIPMLWFYRETLDVSRLVESLMKTLEKFPVLCGRYTRHGSAVSLNNAGVPLEVIYSTADVMTLTSNLANVLDREDAPSTPTTYDKSYLDAFFPSALPQMDPDTATPDTPLLAVKVTSMTPGTAIGVLIQHGVVDAHSALFFMLSWSRMYRGLPLEDDHEPIHDRGYGQDAITTETPSRDKLTILPRGEYRPPTFAALLPKVTGNKVCVMPLTKSRLVVMKELASQGLPPHRFISTDDVISARVWKAFARVRCEQLGIAAESEKSTTLLRDLDLRSRLVPQIKANVFGNTVLTVWTVLTLKQINSMTVSQVALKLRSTIQKWTSGKIVSTIRWMKDQQLTGAKTESSYDSNALTFNVCSWVDPNTSWEDVDFEARPMFCDQKYHSPCVCVYTSRPSRDGVNIWTSGTPESLATFMRVVNHD